MALDGKVALITGGGSGIGRATASALAARGVHLVLFGRTGAKPIASFASGARKFLFCFSEFYETLRPSRLAMRGASRSSRTWRR